MKKHNEDEIDLIEILEKLWNEKKNILKFTFIFFMIGFFYILFSKDIYTASSTFYPHYEKVDNSNSIRNLAGLAGINITNETSSDVPTNLYPNLLKSTPFKRSILNQNIIYRNKKITYKEYLIEKYIKGISLKNIINFKNSNTNDIENNLVKNKNYINLSENEYFIHKKLDENISIEVNEKDGFVKISVNDEIPEIAAEIAKKSEETLQESIINFKLENIRSVYNFTLTQLENSKKSFYNLQDSLARFKDKNKFIKTDIFLNQLNRIQKEYDIASSIYNELALNSEKTAIEVKKNTPIFTIIEPVTIPMRKSNTSSIIVLISFTFLGLFIISFWIVTKDFLIDLRKKIIK